MKQYEVWVNDFDFHAKDEFVVTVCCDYARQAMLIAEHEVSLCGRVTAVVTKRIGPARYKIVKQYAHTIHKTVRPTFPMAA